MDFVHYLSPFDRVGGKGRVNPNFLLGLEVLRTASLSKLPISRLSLGGEKRERGRGRDYGFDLLLNKKKMDAERIDTA
eukprot:scaffold6934_cov121-Isochrysis_galbana.AAC.1